MQTLTAALIVGHNGAQVAQYLNEHSALGLAASAKFFIDSMTYFCPLEYR